MTDMTSQLNSVEIIDKKSKNAKNIIKMELADILLYNILSFTNYKNNPTRFLELCHVCKQWDKVIKKSFKAYKDFYFNILNDIKKYDDIFLKIILWSRLYRKSAFKPFGHDNFFFRPRDIIIFGIEKKRLVPELTTDLNSTDKYDLTDIIPEKEIKIIKNILKQYFKRVSCFRRGMSAGESNKATATHIEITAYQIKPNKLKDSIF